MIVPKPANTRAMTSKLVSYDERGEDDGHGNPDHAMTLPLTPPRW
jgi:hypothetical protein